MTAILTLAPLILSIIGKFIPDGEKKVEIEGEIKRMLLENERELNAAMKAIAVAEIQGNLFQSSWRPLLSYIVILLVLWTFMLKGVAEAAFGVDFGPVDTGALMTFGTMWAGVYGVGRSFEKSGSHFKIRTRRESDEDDMEVETIRERPSNNFAERR